MMTLQGIGEIPEVKVLLEMMALANSEAYYHSLSVAMYTNLMLRECDTYTEERKVEIIKGALLHDIGKIFVPLNLTQCPKALNAQEYDIVKVHATISYEIVKPVFSEIVQNVCLYHHERPNGSGYMSKISLSQIPEEALLVQVADVFDALTSNRSYKKSYSKNEALDILKKEASELRLDDTYVTLLEKVIEKTREKE